MTPCLKEMAPEDLALCAGVYVRAYAQAPWDETHDPDEVIAYLRQFLGSDTRRAYLLIVQERVAGLALGLTVPCVGSAYFRLEDFCVDPPLQGKGLGRAMMDLLCTRVKQEGCDCVLLGTQAGFPAHRFYLRCGFQEVSSVLLHRDLNPVGV